MQLECRYHWSQTGIATLNKFQRLFCIVLHDKAATVHEANHTAKKANALRDRPIAEPVAKKPPTKSAWLYWMNKYIDWAESSTPKLIEKDSWRNRKYEMLKFARENELTPINRTTRAMIKIWWDELSYYQQKSRFAAFRKLFNYLMSEGALGHMGYNPFTTNDDRPRLYLKGEPEPARMRLDLPAFWAIYNRAGKWEYHGLQIAMGIIMVTMWRPGDVCSLTFDRSLDGDYLKAILSNSEKLRGGYNAARRKWNYRNNTLLAPLIKRARELSLQNLHCPYIISHMPKQKRIGKTKDHFCQVTPKRPEEMFVDIRDATELYKSIPEGKEPPTIYEVKSLASARYIEAGYELKDVQEAMGHSDEGTTAIYPDGHELPYQEIDMLLTKEVLGGDFG